MFDHFLGWLVSVIPVVLGLIVIAVPAKHEDAKGHMRWRWALGVALILYGGLVWWQQSRFANTSARDREDAIKQTSQQVAAETSKQVTAAVTEQFKQTVADQSNQIIELKKQLSAQSRDVATIKSSNIVTGKAPIPVQVTNPSAPSGGAAQVENLRMSWEPETSTHNDAPYAEKVTIQTDAPINPIRLLIFRDVPLKYGELKLTDHVIYYDASRIDERDDRIYVLDVSTQGTAPLRPDAPLVVHLYSDKPLHVLRGERGPR